MKEDRDKSNNKLQGKEKKYDGVIYEPSSQAKNTQRYIDKRKDQRVYSSVEQASSLHYKKNKSKKSGFAIFYITTLFIGIVICIVVFTIFFNNFSNQAPEKQNNVAVRVTPQPTEIVVNEMHQLTGVIESLNIKTQELKILDISTGKYHNVYADSATDLKNKFGQALVFSEFEVGDVVDANFNSKTSRLKSLHTSAQMWEMKLIKDVKVDKESKNITVGNDVYKYDDSLIVIYNGERFPISDVLPLDVITMRGVRDKAVTIAVNKSHGYIEIVNKEFIKKGFIEVDTNIYSELENTNKIEVQEGPHRIVIKGNNIEPYIKEITIKAKESIALNLHEAQYKSGMLNIRANVKDFVVSIDEKQVNADEPIMLDYGVHVLSIQKTDYMIWQSNITINSPSRDVLVELKKEVKMGKLTLTSEPSGAQLYVDSALMGTTPYSGMIEYGTRQIMVRLSGYDDKSFTLEVNEDLPQYNVIMIPATPEVITTVTAPPSTPRPSE